MPGDERLFQDDKGVINCGPLIRLEKADLYDLLVHSECFVSKSEAHKNYRPSPAEDAHRFDGIGPALPAGYFEVGPVGKARVMIYCFNPDSREA